MTWINLAVFFGGYLIGSALVIWRLGRKLNGRSPTPGTDPEHRTAPGMPGPIDYDHACHRCVAEIDADEPRWVFPSHHLTGPDLLNLVEVKGGPKLQVCNECGPKLTLTPLLDIKPGNSTITFKPEGDTQ